MLDIKHYGPENYRGYRYVWILNDNFSKFGFTLPLKIKNFQTIKDSSETILMISRSSPILVEINCGKEFLDEIFGDLL